MRIKIDVWSQGLEESKRENIREKLRDIFCQLPARRLWYYLKQLRLMSLKDPSDLNDDWQEDMEGPEDVIVKGSVLSPSLLIKPHFTVMKHIFLLKNPGLELHAKINMDELVRINRFAFEPAGNICDCGIDKLQERARLVTTMLQVTQCHKQWSNALWTDDQNIEMLTRFYVREDVEELLGDQLSDETLLI
ncbi:hypothetical protein UA08_06081 [Talaromyces atroroseus]|uniref:Uncharacterized protein n=1 Tax=Talaromyces atroroseus TaxID=1441469 RepID=A0A225AYL8_TALAT|nr:hypothetical protein UA08_06081 [Talaromyces atroroseus]OKL58587.1 hypothetical protein UA08_06081 [Talaromyces atroroseus]